jgi:hypothetical protein
MAHRTSNGIDSVLNNSPIDEWLIIHSGGISDDIFLQKITGTLKNIAHL